MIKGFIFVFFITVFFSGLAYGQSDQVQLIPCNCEPEHFSTAAFNAEQGYVYVYNKPGDGVKAFNVIENREPGHNFKRVVEVTNPDQQIVSAINSILERVVSYAASKSASDFNSLNGIESATQLAGRTAIQDELSREISNRIQSTIKSDIDFLFTRTRHKNQVSQALGWNSDQGKRITFNDGSYIELRFSEAVMFDNGEVSLEFEVMRMVDAEGRTVGEATSDYVGRELTGTETYINGYVGVVARLGFAVDVQCRTTVGTPKLFCNSTGESCTVVYYRSSC